MTEDLIVFRITLSRSDQGVRSPEAGLWRRTSRGRQNRPHFDQVRPFRQTRVPSILAQFGRRPATSPGIGRRHRCDLQGGGTACQSAHRSERPPSRAWCLRWSTVSRLVRRARCAIFQLAEAALPALLRARAVLYSTRIQLASESSCSWAFSLHAKWGMPVYSSTRVQENLAVQAKVHSTTLLTSIVPILQVCIQRLLLLYHPAIDAGQ